MDKGSLLMIGNYLSSSRHNRNIWHSLADRLRASGWNVITTSAKENKVFRLLDMILTIFQSRKFYSLAQVDIFSGQAFIFAEICTMCLRMIKKPVVFTLHGGRLPEFARKNPWRVKRLLNQAVAVVTPSPYLQRELQKYRDDIGLILNPVDIGRFRFRERITLSPELLWLRAFHKIYNPQLAVLMVAELVREYPGVHLDMIGPDEGDGSLEETRSLIMEKGLSQNVTIHPGIPYTEVPGTLNRFDIFINTSNYDTAPRCILEAMANGLCIVTTNVGGIPWLVKDQSEALLVPPNDPIAMADAIKRVLNQPPFATYLSQNAGKAAARYDWAVILPDWERLFLGIMNLDHV